MKILALSKRQYTNLDLIDDKFGRIRELPIALARLGHEITGVCLSYRSRKEGVYTDIEGDAQVKWHLLNFKRILSFGANSYFYIFNHIFLEKNPDLIWASSDALHIILGAWFAGRYHIPFIADLYDNYESFPETQLPGVKILFRNALKSADGITCVSRPLANYVRRTIAFKGPIEVIENAVPKGVFYPKDKLVCKRQFGLPDDGFFIGTAGAISKSRGIGILFDAFQSLAEKEPHARLVLTGTCDKGIVLPQNNRIHYLGVLPPDKIPALLSALDVMVICNIDSEFGRYCFPQKFYEAVACRVPVVAAAVGAMLEMLKHHPDHLFEPGNVMELESVLRRQMKNPSPLPLKTVTWDIRGTKLEKLFQLILNR